MCTCVCCKVVIWVTLSFVLMLVGMIGVGLSLWFRPNMEEKRFETVYEVSAIVWITGIGIYGIATFVSFLNNCMY